MATLEFRKHFFEEIVTRELGYNPRIEIKPAHLANGFFRAICEGYANNEAQHMAIYPKAYPFLTPELITSDRRLKNKVQNFSPNQQNALRFLNGQDEKRAMLNALFGADKALYRFVNTSSYSLSHASHITNDNHDRDTGLWLYTILTRGESHPALDLLSELLLQSPLDRNDELSLVTLPLDGTEVFNRPGNAFYQEPEGTRITANGLFNDQIVQTIRSSFDRLALNNKESADKNGKLDTLRHFVTLGCFSVYFHLANVNKSSSLVPMIFRFERDLTTLSQASIRSYQRMLRSIDEFMYQKIYATVCDLAERGTYGSWDDDAAIEKHIQNTIDWHRMTTESSRAKEQSAVSKLQQDCQDFYYTYRSKTAAIPPRQALARALSDMLPIVLSSTPQDVVRGLGTRIGLLSQYAGRHRKTYDPHPDFLEVLVRSSIPLNETWTLSKLARHWADSFGILCGALGDENDHLRSLGIFVDQEEWLENTNALAELLELSGYARRYADGVVLVSIEQ
jgi:hypothetical protein